MHGRVLPAHVLQSAGVYKNTRIARFTCLQLPVFAALVQRVFASIPLSPFVHPLIFSSINVRWPGDFSGSARADKNHTAMGSDKDLAER